MSRVVTEGLALGFLFVAGEFDAMIGGGLITLERARLIMYRPADMRASQQHLHRIDGGEDEP